MECIKLDSLPSLLRVQNNTAAAALPSFAKRKFFSAFEHQITLRNFTSLASYLDNFFVKVLVVHQVLVSCTLYHAYLNSIKKSPWSVVQNIYKAQDFCRMRMIIESQSDVIQRRDRKQPTLNK
jgi:hypothetical protein